VICDLHNLSKGEQERICRGWIRQLARDIGPQWDVPSPELMTSAQHMLWMLDEYETIHGSKAPGFITGKPVDLGGSAGRKEATGYGLMIVVREALKELELKAVNTTASIQGFGNIAQNAIQLYQQMGGMVKCVSSWNQEDQTSYSFRKKEGIDLDELLSITNPFGEIHKTKAIELGYECLAGDAWIEQNVDILAPTALENQITPENAGKISQNVKIIAEGADGAIHPKAEQILLQRGIKIIPDILANAGGMICSYYEQVQSNMNYYWKRDEVLGKLDVHLSSIYIDLSNFAINRKATLRDAVYLVAVNRVAIACQERGWV
jgi:glutamate dehydrogenase